MSDESKDSGMGGVEPRIKALFSPEPPMTRCPKCGHEGLHRAGATCPMAEPDEPAPAPSLLDFEQATEVTELLHDYTSQNYHAAYEASLNAQAAALVETARREERRAIWEEMIGFGRLDDPWGRLVDWMYARGVNPEARDDHR